MLNKLIKKYNDKKGFTMIELIAVMAVIAVLITILIPQVSSLRERAVKTEALKVAKDVLQAVQTYELENGRIPVNLDELEDGGFRSIADRTEGISTITAADLSFTYYMVKNGMMATISYVPANEDFTVIITSGGTLPTTGLLTTP
ncbi:prepilin-type N-terminal cleavage/methylation domain-containing protein [Acidaminobacter sp. JC074]|uniref:type II secretion system protein n=1 Tax=Acidaminobacter sp. JC074 TaxID=2530199 RepID=UPI001F104812|nr:prepilin-type N-terminal cleavage/methylation domain-containing protein [Acidaminobacter sp. JC074]MCH4888182.1 prepilin-type N-terminal cleavage/methylation domain-containing protein [Acidaminobacter sp. JC074]